MNNKGFTLIELIATILLLSIISIISFVSINNAIKKGKVNDCKSLQESIKSATLEYVSDHRYTTPSSLTNLNASQLVNGNYLSSPIYNPFDRSQEINPSTILINVTLNDNYTVKDIVISSPTYIRDCTN